MTIRDEIELKRRSEWHKYQCTFCQEYLAPRDRSIYAPFVHERCYRPMQVAKRLVP